MTTLYARLNISFHDDSDVAATAQRIQSVLRDAATEGGSVDFEVFFLEELGVVGVAEPFEDGEAFSLFEAGQILGYVRRCVEQSKIGSLSFWSSIVGADGELLDSSL